VLRRRRQGEPLGQPSLQGLPAPGYPRRGGVRGRGDPARLREGVALRRVVEELRGGAAVHVGGADQPAAGLLHGAELRDEHEGGLPRRAHRDIRRRICPAVVHRKLGWAVDVVLHGLEVFPGSSAPAIQGKTCRQAAVSSRRRFRGQLLCVSSYNFRSVYHFWILP